MSDHDPLPMPSDVRPPADAPVTPGDGPIVEPPSVKLIVRLFLIPLLIVAAAVGVMWLVALLAGGTPSTEELLTRLRASGGGRTAEVLVGPGSKQRYLDAKALVDSMKDPATMTEAYRIGLTDQLITILRDYTHPGEGEIRHFLLLALGRTWQIYPGQSAMESPQAVDARQQTVETLRHYAQSDTLSEQKAAILALVFMAGQPEAHEAIPFVIDVLENPQNDLDVRLAAATVLGPLATPDDANAIAALEAATREDDQRNAELIWSATLSLAQLNQPQATDTILMLLDREQLAQLRVYDRESDPQNPTFRPLSDQEILRYLVNTIIGAKNLRIPQVQERLRELEESDPSPRVRAAATEVLSDFSQPVEASSTRPME